MDTQMQLPLDRTAAIQPRDAITIQGWPVRVQHIGHTWVRLFDGEGTVDYARSLFDREVRAGKIVRVSA